MVARENSMRVVVTMDGFEVFRGTVSECAEFLRAWAIVSTTAVRTVDVQGTARPATIIDDETLFGVRG